MRYFFKVTKLSIEDGSAEGLCKRFEWKISSTTPDGTPVFSSDDASLISTSDYTLSSASFADYDYLQPQITFRDLTGAAVGETTGEGANASITLDTDAAGHGWYEGGMFSFGGLGLDANFNSSLSPTLSQGERGLNDSSNWLPTSNPNEWVARADTAAASKMDMLSVLLHEYGHALGIAHSSDAHDYMATTLTPGMRRLPSSSDMQLMAQLAAEAREAIMAGQGYTLTVANNTDAPLPSPLMEQLSGRLNPQAGKSPLIPLAGEGNQINLPFVVSHELVEWSNH